VWSLGDLDRLVGGEVAEGLVVLLVGQETVSSLTRVSSSRPIISTRLLPPKLELLRRCGGSSGLASEDLRSTRILARGRAVGLVPTSLTLSNGGPGRVLKQGVVA